MDIKLGPIWLFLIVLAAIFSLLYLWFTLFPGRVEPQIWHYFNAAQVEQGRAYSRVSRLIYLAVFWLQVIFLWWFIVSGRAVALSRISGRLGADSIWSYVIFFAILWLALLLIKLPLQFYHGYFWQHRWGFSTQTMGAWWLDLLKGATLELVLSAVGVAFLFWLMGKWPGMWWLMAATFLSLWLLVQTLLWPVVVAPLFNQFTPAQDAAVVNLVQRLAVKADLPVDQVLIMDASRRTTKANAYFTGIGHTKRIVLYDNLIQDYPLDEVEAVVAHEMAHWQQGHIKQGLMLGILANFIFWGFLFILLRLTLWPAHHYPPYTWALVVLVVLLVGFCTNPISNYFSRAMEKEADRVAVMITENYSAAVRLEVRLATENKADLAPSAFIGWFSYTHPPVLERIKIIKQAGGIIK